MMDLETMKYLDSKFQLLHERVNDVIVDVAEAKNATCNRLTKLEVQYKDHVKHEMDKEGKKYKLRMILTTIALGVLGFLQGINIFS